MNCEAIEALLVPHLDGTLDPAERDAVEAHLAGCAACRERREFLRTSAAWLRGGLMAETPLVAAPARRRSGAIWVLAASTMLLLIGVVPALRELRDEGPAKWAAAPREFEPKPDALNKYKEWRPRNREGEVVIERRGHVGVSVNAERMGRDESLPGEKARTWKRSQLVPNTSRLSIGDRESLPLEAMQVAVRVDGFRARVLIDFYFHNTHDRQYEGTFELRLPDGASPYFLAFGQTARRAQGPELAEVDGGDEPAEIMARRAGRWTAPREARMVARAQAARAYSETVRGRVDPALLEWSGAGVFSARIFPIAPRAVHRVVLGYDVDLLAIGAEQELRLDLPQGLPRLAVDLGVHAPRGANVRVNPERQPSRIGGRLWYRFDDPRLRSIVVRLAGDPAPLLVGTERKTSYFAARFRPDLPADATAAGSQRAVFLLDTSLSANPDRFNVWLQLLEAVLERNRPRLARFAVLCFNVEAFWHREAFVANTKEEVAALLRWCRTLALEGATNLQGALAEAVRPAWLPASRESHDLFLFSDGAATWGEAGAHALARTLQSGFAGPLFAYRTGLSGTDTELLAQLCGASGGALFSVAGPGELQAAAVAHTRRPWRLMRVALPGASDLLLAGRPRTLFPGQRLVLVGRGAPRQGAIVELRVRRGPESRTLRIPLGAPIRSALAPRTYGQVATAELETLGRATQTVAVPYARHFRVTGRGCSLLMLESEADYQRFGIKPEADAQVVERTPAAHEIESAADTVGDALGDPKAEFLAWLRRLGQERPHVRLPAAFQAALAALPAEAFDVATRALVCKQRTWNGIPGRLTEQLASRKLDYDDWSAEAERRLVAHGPDDALKAASSLVEARPGDLVLARDVCLSAMGWGKGGQAYHTLRRVARARPWEPMTYHAIAQCLVQQRRHELALAFFEIGLAGRWDARYGDFRRIVGLAYLNLLRKIARGTLRTRLDGYARARLAQVSAQFPLRRADLVVTIAWNTDSTDVDLHVVEPSGERCYYQHARTAIGGELTRDVTTGYGPEMYVLRKAVAGVYRVQAVYFSSDRNRASARTKVYATIYRNWGAPDETVLRKVIVLARNKQMHDIAALLVK